jgi:hypothetical protein
VNDPHLTRLVYTFRAPPESYDFSEAARLNAVLADFSCRLEDGRLVAEPRRHYSTVEEARADLEPRLRAWGPAS